MSNLGIWNSTFEFCGLWNLGLQTFKFGVQTSTFGCQTLDFGTQSSNFEYSGLGFQTFRFGLSFRLGVNPRIWELKFQTFGILEPGNFKILLGLQISTFGRQALEFRPHI
jgi:hypothetical protein